MKLPTKTEINTFVQTSIKNKQFNEKLQFALPIETIRRVKGILHFDMNGYMCILSSHAIRHIKKNHPQDTIYICEIPDIIQNFTRVEKSLTKDHKTGAHLISLEFYKKYNKRNVKLVKLKIHIKKRLELKTLFVEE